jgi:hypothetical protein
MTAGGQPPDLVEVFHGPRRDLETQNLRMGFEPLTPLKPRPRPLFAAHASADVPPWRGRPTEFYYRLPVGRMMPSACELKVGSDCGQHLEGFVDEAERCKDDEVEGIGVRTGSPGRVCASWYREAN